MSELRYYQREAVEAVYREWEKVQSTAIIGCTASGKTEIYLEIAKSYPGRVLVVVHRDYLITQPINRLATQGFDDVAVEKAEQRSEGGMTKAKVVFASIQSLSRLKRLEAFDPSDFSALIIDEAHRATAKSYRTVLEHFKLNPRIRILLLTATPKRKDGVALGTVCDSVAYVYGPKTAMNEGWIVPLRFYRREVEGLDFSSVKLKGTDLDQEEIERLLLQEKPLHRVCASLANDRGPTVIFCPGVMIARAYCTLMNERYRPNSAAVLWAESTEEEREYEGKRLSKGDIDYLFNCELFVEGYDVPDLVRIVWAAPTASLVKFTQGTGRVFRTHGSLRSVLTGGRECSEERKALIQQSPKPLGHVVTYYPQNCKHQLCEPNDILGGAELKPDVKAYAKQIQEATASQPGGSDPDEDVDTGNSIVELRALLEERRSKIRAVADSADYEYDAWGGSRNRNSGNGTNGERNSVKEVSGDWPEGKPASAAMLGWIRYHVPKAAEIPLTAWRAYTIRQLVGEHGVNPDTALSYGKRKALAVLESYKRAKNGS